jgi:hypothetical protein
MQTGDTMTAEQRCPPSSHYITTRLRCARGHVREHEGSVTPIDIAAPCWCGGLRVAATVYRPGE